MSKIAFNPENGSLIWETRLALPKGRTELERMIDIDGKPLLVSDIMFSQLSRAAWAH